MINNLIKNQKNEEGSRDWFKWLCSKLHNENVRASLSNDKKNEKLSLVSQLANRIKSFFKKMKDEGEQ